MNATNLDELLDAIADRLVSRLVKLGVVASTTYLTAAEEFHARTGFTRRQIEDAIRSGKLKGVKVRKGYSVEAAELSRWASERTLRAQRIVRVARKKPSNDDGVDALRAAGLVPGGR